MRMRRVFRSRGEADQYADDASFDIHRQQLAGNSGCHFFPFRSPPGGWWRYCWPACFPPQAVCEPRPQRGRRPQDVRWPKREAIEQPPQQRDLVLACGARANVRRDPSSLLIAKRMQGKCACKLGLLATVPGSHAIPPMTPLLNVKRAVVDWIGENPRFASQRGGAITDGSAVLSAPGP
jgi:hypothetical protein